MIILLLKLLLAHVLGDFVFQSDKWVEDKLKRKHKSPYLYAHIALHALFTFILLAFDATLWLGVLCILISHYLIDLLKINLNEKLNPRLLFGLDQLAHLLILFLVAYSYADIKFDFDFLNSISFLSVVFSLIFLISVSSVLMKVLMSKWNLEDINKDHSLEMAGKYIGILERLIIFGCIALGQWQAVGWLIAAKSIFRFGDLSKSKDRKLTEYILIGTLLSFGFAIMTGIFYLLIRDL
ncbi:MAG: DUF3307 domain-containing protein [Flavobacteriales bacterium]